MINHVGAAEPLRIASRTVRTERQHPLRTADGTVNGVPATIEIDLGIDPIAYRYESWSEMADEEIEKGVARCANCGAISPVVITPNEEMRPIGRRGRTCCSDTSSQLLTINEPSDGSADD